jgi:hypothetical protein
MPFDGVYVFAYTCPGLMPSATATWRLELVLLAMHQLHSLNLICMLVPTPTSNALRADVKQCLGYQTADT